MKKQLFFLITLIAALSGSFTMKAQDVAEVVEALNESVQTVRDVLNKPVVVVDESNDTIYKMNVDSTQVITVKIKNQANDTTSLYDTMEFQQMKRKYETRVLAISVIAPCAVMVLIALGILVFLLVRIHGRNKLIEKAIINNYQLPDSFYTGKNTPQHIHVVNETVSVKTEDTVQEDKPGATQLPPIPTINQRIQAVNPIERRMLFNAFILVGVGLLVFLFFVCVHATAVGILAGGIPMIIGGSRIFSILYFRNRP